MEIENWENTGNELVRELTFDNQTELASCLMAIAEHSDKVNHHADMQITKAVQLRLSITTHDAGKKLTQKDAAWAMAVNELIRRFK